jgi:O-antigen/teichoic acid export membrane protein
MADIVASEIVASDTSVAPASTETTSLRHRTVLGVFWLAMQSVATRGVVMIQQLLLAWLLAKEDFGLIALTYTVSTFVNLLANPGIDTVLVQRQRRFRLWATPAFWLGMTTGIAGMIVMAVAAPIAAWAYGQPKLVGLILVLAMGAPLQTLQIVPRANLQSAMRFRSLVSLNFVGNVLTAIFSVLLAFFGFGAYSFAIPVPIVAGLVAILAWKLAGTSIHRNPRFGRWKYLLADSAAMGGTQFMFTLIGQGDYLCLGLAGVSEASIGVYYFAYRLSTQSFSLIANAVPMVLFPSLSQLVLDPHRQLRATLRASRLLAVVAVPFCLLQILLAEPVIRLLCPPRWLDAVVPLQILTVGMMINAPAWPCTSLMMAQRRFRDLLRVATTYAAAFVAIVATALWIDRSIIAAAIGVSVWQWLSSPYAYWEAVRPQVPLYGYFAEVYRPFVAGLVPFAICAMLVAQFPGGWIGDLSAIVVVAIAFCVVYLILLTRLAKEDVRDLLVQLQPVIHRVKAWYGS